MFTVRDLIDRPWVRAQIRRSGLAGTCPDHRTIILDSGGYQYFKAGRFLLSVAEVIELYREARPAFGVSLDRPIPFDLDPNSAAEAAASNVANFDLLVRELGEERVIPVVHGFEHGLVERQCKRLARIVGNPTIVGIGGSVPLFMEITRCHNQPASVTRKLNLLHRFNERITVVRSFFPRSRLHVFGAGSLRSIAMSFAAGADSVDSAGWRLRAAYGCVTGRRSKQVRLQRLRSLGISLNEALGGDLRSCGCPSCARSPTVEQRASQLASSFTNRALHNFWVLAAEVEEILASHRTDQLAANTHRFWLAQTLG
jgi:queuine/archaeosine tRNA-ribosyltransferase